MLIITAIVTGLTASSAAVYYENQKCFGQCMESTTCNLQYQKCNSKCNTSIAEGVRENFLDNYWLNAERLDSNHSANLDPMKKNHDQFTVRPLKTEQQENKNRTKYIIKANRKRSIEDEWSILDDLLIGLTSSEDLDDGLMSVGASRSKRHSLSFNEIVSKVMSLMCSSFKSGAHFGHGHGHGHAKKHIDAGRRPQMVEGEEGDQMNYALFSNQPHNPQEQQIVSLELCCKPC